ncbi:MAG: HEAT repeat domain-containing protein [Leptospiraceae bacterium]|nr:HEAT repeat domain-containing protein [Leptospiraceae bacterium]MDW7976908.1 HEAT repeat domain-containing protein [Leptospiraceae bacterium]
MRWMLFFLFVFLNTKILGLDLSKENLYQMLEKGGEDRLRAIWLSYETRQYVLFRIAANFLLESENEEEHLLVLRIFDLLGQDLEWVLPNWHILLDEFLTIKRSKEVLIPSLNLIKKWKERKLIYALIRLTKHPEYEIRRMSLEVLQELSSDQIVPVIIQYLKSPSNLTKIYGLEISYYYKDNRLIPFLRELIQHPNKSVRIYAIRALSEYENEHFYIFRNYPTETEEVQKVMIEIIGEKSLTQYQNYVLAGISDPNKSIRKASLIAAKNFPQPNFIQAVSNQLLIEQDDELIIEGILLLSRFGKDPQKVLIHLLSNQNPKIRLLSLQTIQELKLSDYLEDLLFFLEKEKESSVHLEIVYTLSSLVNERNYKILLESLNYYKEFLNHQEKYLIYSALQPYLSFGEEVQLKRLFQIF